MDYISFTEEPFLSSGATIVRHPPDRLLSFSLISASKVLSAEGTNESIVGPAPEIQLAKAPQSDAMEVTLS